MPAGVVLLVLGFAEHERLADAVALPGELDESSVASRCGRLTSGMRVCHRQKSCPIRLDSMFAAEDDAPSLVAAGDDLVEQPAPSMSKGT